MAKDKQQREGDGKATLDADGKVILGDTDPCCCGGCPGEDCEYCTGPTPIRYTVTFSDVELLADCHTQDGRSVELNTLVELDGTWTLNQTADPCVWQSVATGNVASIYLAENCSPGFGYHPFTSIIIYLTRTAGFHLKVEGRYVDFDSNVHTVLLYDDDNITGDCMAESLASTNEITDFNLAYSGGEFIANIGKDGTAVITPC